MSSKRERIEFSRREVQLLYFAERPQARMHPVKRCKVLSGEAAYID